MFDILLQRLKQRHRTIPFPSKKLSLPGRYKGRPVIENNSCVAGCTECVDACPVSALDIVNGKLQLDLCRCIFCAECLAFCGRDAIRFTQDFKLAATRAADLLIKSDHPIRVREVNKDRLRCLKNSLKLRQVSAGGCNACEADVNVLNTVTYDLSRFGVQFVASPRHADGILITGPVTKNMRLALEKTYEAVPPPKIVVAVGACSISGGLFRNHEQVFNGADSIVPVDLYIPGCPPHPYTILHGILELLGKI